MCCLLVSDILHYGLFLNGRSSV